MTFFGHVILKVSNLVNVTPQKLFTFEIRHISPARELPNRRRQLPNNTPLPKDTSMNNSHLQLVRRQYNYNVVKDALLKKKGMRNSAKNADIIMDFLTIRLEAGMFFTTDHTMKCDCTEPSCTSRFNLYMALEMVNLEHDKFRFGFFGTGACTKYLGWKEYTFESLGMRLTGTNVYIRVARKPVWMHVSEALGQTKWRAYKPESDSHVKTNAICASLVEMDNPKYDDFMEACGSAEFDVNMDYYLWKIGARKLFGGEFQRGEEFAAKLYPDFVVGTRVCVPPDFEDEELTHFEIVALKLRKKRKLKNKEKQIREGTTMLLRTPKMTVVRREDMPAILEAEFPLLYLSQEEFDSLCTVVEEEDSE